MYLILKRKSKKKEKEKKIASHVCSKSLAEQHFDGH